MKYNKNQMITFQDKYGVMDGFIEDVITEGHPQWTGLDHYMVYVSKLGYAQGVTEDQII